MLEVRYSARRLMGSRMMESAAYCNQVLLAQICTNSAQITSVNWIIRLLLSLSCRPKVILLSGGHCIELLTFELTFSLLVLEKITHKTPQVLEREKRILWKKMPVGWIVPGWAGSKGYGGFCILHTSNG
jgi:hypothetical protein